MQLLGERRGRGKGTARTGRRRGARVRGRLFSRPPVSAGNADDLQGLPEPLLAFRLSTDGTDGTDGTQGTSGRQGTHDPVARTAVPVPRQWTERAGAGGTAVPAGSAAGHPLTARGTVDLHRTGERATEQHDTLPRIPAYAPAGPTAGSPTATVSASLPRRPEGEPAPLTDPLRQVNEPSRIPEAMLTAVLAAVAGMAAWGAATPREVWVPLCVLPVAGLAALLRPGGPRARVTRAAIVLTVSALLPLLAPRMTPVTLVVALASVAVYPLLVGTLGGRVVTVAALLSLAAPLGVILLGPDLLPGALPTPLVDDLTERLSAADPTGSVQVALGCGLLVVALVGHCSIAFRRTVTGAAQLAVIRERTARATSAQLDVAASSDGATGLLNRDALLRAVTLLLDHGQRRTAPRTAGHISREQPVGLLLADIDRFAALADSLGAPVADDVATQVAGRLETGLPEAAALARTGRGQFAVLVTDATADTCADTARRITALLATPVAGPVRDLAITCSVGAAISGPGLRTADDLLLAADEAVRTAQRHGRSRWQMYDQSVREQTAGRADLEIELQDAVMRGTVDVAFQPILALDPGTATGPAPQEGTLERVVPLGADRIVAAEALARWTRTDGSVVDPDDFVPLADELGFGGTLGMQVIRRSLEALAQWRRAGGDIDQVWVNVAASQLEDPEFAHEVAAQLAIRGLAPSCLVLEVGAARLGQNEQTLGTLGLLRSLGIAVALDDFGRSGTSLAALHRLPISAVKIDPCLTADLGGHDLVLRATVELCHSLGLRVVLEGVETMVQLNGARTVGADAVQGFALARPMSARDVSGLVALRRPQPEPARVG